MSKNFGANSSFARSTDAVGWALFFVWIGIALLTDIGWTWSLAGMAAIILGMQVALFIQGERLDVFMLALSVVLLSGAAADVFGSAWSLIPALLIVLGVAMLADALRTGSRRRITKA